MQGCFRLKPESEGSADVYDRPDGKIPMSLTQQRDASRSHPIRSSPPSWESCPPEQPQEDWDWRASAAR